MTLLLDTHALLWWLDDPKLLSKEARRAIRDSRNRVYVSAVVAWEIAIKKALGKLAVPDNLDAAITANDFLELPISISHALGVMTLPDHHRDPIDRLLIAQALLEHHRLITRDTDIQNYAVPLIVA